MRTIYMLMYYQRDCTEPLGRWPQGKSNLNMFLRVASLSRLWHANNQNFVSRRDAESTKTHVLRLCLPTGCKELQAALLYADKPNGAKARSSGEIKLIVLCTLLSALMFFMKNSKLRQRIHNSALKIPLLTPRCHLRERSEGSLLQQDLTEHTARCFTSVQHDSIAGAGTNLEN